MTPKEKAKEIVEKHAIWHWGDSVCNYESAKESAKISVLEIIKTIENIQFYNDLLLDQLLYWNNIKEEINGL